MTGLHFEQHYWSLEALFGISSTWLRLNQTTIVSTWALLGILLGCIILLRVCMQWHEPFRWMIVKMVESFFDFVDQSIGTFSFSHAAFIATLFIFIFLANILSFIPGLEEPTTDLNTTVALSLISFFYVQIFSIVTIGVLPYIKGYFKPFFLMLPLNIIGKVSSIISLSFRLYGNIFSGAVISSIYFSMLLKRWWVYQFFGIGTGLNLLIMGFTLFEGFLQAIVFTMLSLTYLSIALSGEDH